MPEIFGRLFGAAEADRVGDADAGPVDRHHPDRHRERIVMQQPTGRQPGRTGIRDQHTGQPAGAAVLGPGHRPAVRQPQRAVRRTFGKRQQDVVVVERLQAQPILTEPILKRPSRNTVIDFPWSYSVPHQHFQP